MDTVTWLQHGKGERGPKCENWRLKNSRVQRNRSFLGSVATAFVHDGMWAESVLKRLRDKEFPVRNQKVTEKRKKCTGSSVGLNF